MPFLPIKSQASQTHLSTEFAAPGLWRNNIPTLADQVKNLKLVNLWRDQPIRLDSLMSLDTIPLYNDLDQTDNPTLIEVDPSQQPRWKQRARFYSDKIVFYPVALNPRPKEDQPKKCLANLTRGNFRGFISKGSAKTIRLRLECWIKAIRTNKKEYKGKFSPKHSNVVFLTLTLPADQIHSDNEIKRSALMPFFQQLKRVSGVEEYFWSGEPQENGNIHFHVLVDRFIRKELLQDLWNSSINNLGYLDRYIEATGDISPPSTQIMVCPPDMSLVKYVLKYVSKQPHIQYAHSSLADHQEFKATYWQHEEIKGGYSELVDRGLEVGIDAVDLDGLMYRNRITSVDGKVFRWYERRSLEGRSWGMSKGLSKLDIYGCDVSYRLRDIRSVLEWNPDIRFVQHDFCEVFYCNVHDVLLRNDQELLQHYEKYYLNVYADLYLPKKDVDLDQCKVLPLAVPEVEKHPSYIQTALYLPNPFLSSSALFCR